MAVVNVSEGRHAGRLAALVAAADPSLLDVHSDSGHHRSVFTLAGPDVFDAAMALTAVAVDQLDLSGHAGAHPRIGAVDVVPWVNLSGAGLGVLRDGPASPALAARDRFAAWAASTLGLPAFLYGIAAPGDRTLPEIRRRAWHDLLPDVGPDRPHRSAGAVAVGARPAMVAYNLWLADADLATARSIATSVRGPWVRSLGLAVGDSVQVSCNLVAPWRIGPGGVFDAVASRAGVARAELVGLAPAAVLAAEPRHRWAELDLDSAATIEARLEQAGLDGGSLGRARPGRSTED